ncbi:MAG: 2-C-methyl-D-erythritol 4-phosphate cytidylyltransferase [Puniceicoccales bacterium]|jgi:2-C-methyl-D-erythritol 4-phosphate cytidylyltransferase|nr:2-C-methyl-D-erythritol 4-phosphate cytidylyltransferase [Puniceicoccales bacterium]
MNSIAIFLAGGSGSRMRGAVRDKILEPLAGVPVIAHSVRAFREAGVAGGFVFVCRDDAQAAEIGAALRPWLEGVGAVHWTHGGAERQDSVLSGLEACPDGTDLAFIHDAARPLVSPAALRELGAAAARDGAAVLAHRIKDTIKRVPTGARTGDVVAAEDLDRSTLWGMETPQVFRHSLILEAYRRVAADGARVTDDVAAAARAGHKVTLVENLSPNPKITEPHDLALVSFLLERGKQK